MATSEPEAVSGGPDTAAADTVAVGHGDVAADGAQGATPANPDAVHADAGDTAAGAADADDGSQEGGRDDASAASAGNSPRTGGALTHRTGGDYRGDTDASRQQANALAPWDEPRRPPSADAEAGAATAGHSGGRATRSTRSSKASVPSGPKSPNRRSAGDTRQRLHSRSTTAHSGRRSLQSRSTTHDSRRGSTQADAGTAPPDDGSRTHAGARAGGRPTLAMASMTVCYRDRHGVTSTGSVVSDSRRGRAGVVHVLGDLGTGSAATLPARLRHSSSGEGRLPLGSTLGVAYPVHKGPRSVSPPHGTSTTGAVQVPALATSVFGTHARAALLPARV